MEVNLARGGNDQFNGRKLDRQRFIFPLPCSVGIVRRSRKVAAIPFWYFLAWLRVRVLAAAALPARRSVGLL